MTKKEFMEMQQQAKTIMEYKHRHMKKFSEVTTSINKNFDNPDYEWMFIHTDSQDDTIHVCGTMTDVFAINVAIGVLVNQIRKSRLNATQVFKEMFNQCNELEIKAIINSLYGKQS